MYDSTIHGYPPAVLFLLQHGITMVEYGQQTMRKHGYPQVAHYLEYVISDSELQTASNLLKEHGFHLIEHDLASLRLRGNIESEGCYYTSTKQSEGRSISIQLLPSSLVHVPMDGLKSILECKSSDPAVHTLGIAEHCMSLIRTIMDYPLKSRSRLKPLIELTALIAYDIFEYEWHSKDWYEPEESDEEFQRRVEFSIQKIRSWGLAKEYDIEQRLLEELVRGTMRDDDIPFRKDVDVSCTRDAGIPCTKDANIPVTKDANTPSTGNTDIPCTKDADTACTEDTEISCTGDIDTSCTKDDDISSTSDDGNPSLRDVDIPCTRDADIPGAKDGDVPCTGDTDIPCTKDDGIPSTRDDGFPSTIDDDIPSTRDVDILCTRDAPLIKV